MAKEIRLLSGHGGKYSVLFLFPIGTPKTYEDGDGNTKTVVATPAPEGEIGTLLSTAEKSACDDGTLAWTTVVYGPSDSQTNANHKDALRAKYAREKTKLAADYEAQYRHIGVTFDAV